eukprot:3531873-Rhodomonas_salina.1
MSCLACLPRRSTPRLRVSVIRPPASESALGCARSRLAESAWGRGRGRGERGPEAGALCAGDVVGAEGLGASCCGERATAGLRVRGNTAGPGVTHARYTRTHVTVQAPLRRAQATTLRPRAPEATLFRTCTVPAPWESAHGSNPTDCDVFGGTRGACLSVLGSTSEGTFVSWGSGAPVRLRLFRRRKAAAGGEGRTRGAA